MGLTFDFVYNGEVLATSNPLEQASNIDTELELAIMVKNSAKKKAKIILCENVNLNLTLKKKEFRSSLFSKMNYMIEKNDGSTTSLSDSITNNYNFPLKREPGKWKIFVEATLVDSPDTTVKSNTVEIEIEFPQLYFLNNGNKKNRSKNNINGSSESGVRIFR